MGSRANKTKRVFFQKLVFCPVLNFFPGFPLFTYTFIFIVRRLHGFVFFPSFQHAIWTEILFTSLFATCSNLQWNICPHMSKSITSIIHSAFNFTVLKVGTTNQKSYFTLCISSTSCLFSWMLAAVWIGKVWLSEMTWPAFILFIFSTFLFSITRLKYYYTFLHVLINWNVHSLFFFLIQFFSNQLDWRKRNSPVLNSHHQRHITTSGFIFWVT